MPEKPFVAARIPESLNLKLEEHSKATGESKTQALINALAAYLGFNPGSEVQETASDRLSVLEQKVAELERLVKEPKQFSLLDTEPLTVQEPKKPKQISRSETPSKITVDNNADNESSLIPLPQQKGELVQAGVKTKAIPELPGLEGEDPKKIKIRLNNTRNTKSQTTQIGNYVITLTPPNEEDPTRKKQELLWDVYLAE